MLFLLGIQVGLGSVISGFMHIFYRAATAPLIGWSSGSPFQYEMGIADTSFGPIAIMAIFVRGSFLLTGFIANSVYLLGCMLGDIGSALSGANGAEYNIGLEIWISDAIVPLVLIYSCFLSKNSDEPNIKNNFTFEKVKCEVICSNRY